MKVLIVEDNLDDRKILRYFLDQFDCRILEAANGAEGFELAVKERPDLIISDAMMPVVDGFQFLRNVRNSETLSETPFIFYSATCAGDRDKDLAQSLGSDAFIVKPMASQEFLRELKRVLQGLRPEKRRVNRRLLKDEQAYQKEYRKILSSRQDNRSRQQR